MGHQEIKYDWYVICRLYQDKEGHRMYGNHLEKECRGRLITTSLLKCLQHSSYRSLEQMNVVFLTPR